MRVAFQRRMTRGAHFLCVVSAVLIAGCTDPAIWSDDVRSLTISRGAGGPPPPFIPTGECPEELVRYELSVSPAALDASICVAQSVVVALPIVHLAATVSLTAAQLDGLDPALEMLRVTDDAECTEDVAAYQLTVTRVTGSSEYGDSGVAGCPSAGGHPAVRRDALMAVESAFHKLAFPAPQ